ncbi:MAG: class I SAM-dependent methyltransferase [Chloroflexi bacterium]|nr:class I SAM-dependent methyltransferase [Chloroflexota bacterium]
MQQNRMYHDLAHLWPVISPPEEYAEEAGHLRETFLDRLGPGRHSLLELGVGGGHVLSHLTQVFDATAVDLSPDMLALSERLNPGVEHHLGDMRSVRLPQTFQAVLIHDAVGYMLTEDDLLSAFRTAKAHLEPGGVLVVAPDWFQETFQSPSVLHWVNRRDDLEVTLIEYVHDPDVTDTTIESIFFYLINGPGGLRVEQDRHLTGLFPKATWRRLLGEVGFATEEISYPSYQGGYGQGGYGGNLIVATLR